MCGADPPTKSTVHHLSNLRGAKPPVLRQTDKQFQQGTQKHHQIHSNISYIQSYLYLQNHFLYPIKKMYLQNQKNLDLPILRRPSRIETPALPSPRCNLPAPRSGACWAYKGSSALAPGDLPERHSRWESPRNHGKSWKNMEKHGNTWKIMENHGKILWHPLNSYIIPETHPISSWVTLW